MAAFWESGWLDQGLNQLIEGEALEQYANELGFGVSKRLVDGRIADLPVFAGVSGRFDQARFERFLRQNTMTEAQLRRDIRQQLPVEKFDEPVGRMPRVSTAARQSVVSGTSVSVLVELGGGRLINKDTN